MSLIVGIHAQAGAGKDAAAEALTRTGNFKRFGFADPIKEALEVMYGWTELDWEDREWRERPSPFCGGKSPRILAQTLGTEWGRDLVSPHIWVNIMATRRAELLSRAPNLHIVIADVRFENEAWWIKNNQGIMIELTRSGTEAVGIEGHRSEDGLPLDLIDFVINNSGTKEELQDTVLMRVVQELEGREELPCDTVSPAIAAS